MQEHTATYIADLIRQGFTAGVGPRWSISFEFDHYAPEGERRVETIADLVEKGQSSGPGWKLMLTEIAEDNAVIVAGDATSPAPKRMHEEMRSTPARSAGEKLVFTVDEFVLIMAASQLVAAGLDADHAFRAVRAHAEDVLRATTERQRTFMVVAAETSITGRTPLVRFLHEDEMLQALAAERSIFIALTAIRDLADRLPRTTTT